MLVFNNPLINLGTETRARGEWARTSLGAKAGGKNDDPQILDGLTIGERLTIEENLLASVTQAVKEIHLQTDNKALEDEIGHKLQKEETAGETHAGRLTDKEGTPVETAIDVTTETSLEQESIIGIIE